MGHLQITGCPSLVIFEIAWRAFFGQKNNPNTLYYGAECGIKVYFKRFMSTTLKIPEISDEERTPLYHCAV
jgi:hypothetical protein